MNITSKLIAQCLFLGNASSGSVVAAHNCGITKEGVGSYRIDVVDDMPTADVMDVQITSMTGGTGVIVQGGFDAQGRVLVKAFDRATGAATDSFTAMVRIERILRAS